MPRMHDPLRLGEIIKELRWQLTRLRGAAMNISQSAEVSTGMAQIARVVVPGLPHHVTQRGNRREPVFFEADDYRPYRRLAAAVARRAGIPVWAYRLMPNHVHLGCAGGRGWVAAISAEARRHYTAAISTGSDGRAIYSRVALATDSARGRVRTKSCDEGATAQWHRARSGGC